MRKAFDKIGVAFIEVIDLYVHSIVNKLWIVTNYIEQNSYKQWNNIHIGEMFKETMLQTKPTDSC